jgi:uncharacterized membrane protein
MRRRNLNPEIEQCQEPNDKNMDQDETNQNEWNNPKNWSTLTYRSRTDSRLFVPKRSGLGATINFGHKYGTPLFAGFLLSAILPGVIAVIWVLLRK